MNTSPMQSGMSTLQTIVAAVVAVMVLSYVGIIVAGMQETRDAEKVEQVQIVLQESLSRGMTRLGIPPEQIHPANLINSLPPNTLPTGVHLNDQMILFIERSGRQAQYKAAPSGDLVIVSLKDFSRFHVEEGRIVRNNRWSTPPEWGQVKQMIEEKSPT